MSDDTTRVFRPVPSKVQYGKAAVRMYVGVSSFTASTKITDFQRGSWEWDGADMVRFVGDDENGAFKVTRNKQTDAGAVAVGSLYRALGFRLKGRASVTRDGNCFTFSIAGMERVPFAGEKEGE